eukprot:6372206-Amphidinium_carterae.1
MLCNPSRNLARSSASLSSCQVESARDMRTGASERMVTWREVVDGSDEKENAEDPVRMHATLNAH